MKRLTLIRHAKSSWAETGLSDFERPLNKRGHTAAPLMGGRLIKHHIKPDIMISSPAMRARETIMMIAKSLAYSVEEIIWKPQIYEAEISALTSVIREIENSYHHALLCGHNPGFTELANFLTNHHIENIPTCGVVSISFDTLKWEEISSETGNLILFDYPKKSSNGVV